MLNEVMNKPFSNIPFTTISQWDWSALSTIASLTALLATNTANAGQDWPQWRGPNGDGTSDSTNLPTTWSTNQNIVWKTELPSWSGSTPVIFDERVFVTSPAKSSSGGEAQPEERRGDRGGAYGVSDPGGSTLLLICISKKNGTVLWQKKLDEGNRLWRKQNSSSPSPATDGKHV